MSIIACSPGSLCPLLPGKGVVMNSCVVTMLLGLSPLDIVFDLIVVGVVSVVCLCYVYLFIQIIGNTSV